MSDLQSKTDEELNGKLAELHLGYVRHSDYWQHCRDGSYRSPDMLPRFCSSLDEVARVEDTLQCLEGDYFDNLRAITKRSGVPIYRATARQRTIALIETVQKP